MAPKSARRMLFLVSASLAARQVSTQAQLESNNNVNLQNHAKLSGPSIVKPLPIQATDQALSSINLQARDEPEGEDCSPEGQWNCMPDTWQRCAAGKWSQVMDLAEGTICTPEGLTEDITIEHDGSVNGEDGDDSGNDGGDAFGGGARTGVAVGFSVVAGVFALL